MKRYLRYKWIRDQSWSRFPFGAFGSPAENSCTKTFKIKNYNNTTINKLPQGKCHAYI